MAGGAADKVGNQYEHWWTCYRIAEVLTGSASNIRLEPPGVSGEGVEFQIDYGGRTWAEQVKGGTSGTSWTVTRLKSEGVLTSAREQILLGRAFRIVVALQSTEMATLSDRSRDTVSCEEFVTALSTDLRAQFNLLVSAWESTADDAWQWLRSFFVEQHSHFSLRRLVDASFLQLLSDDPKVVLGELRNYCDDHLHEVLTAAAIWSHLEQKGFHRRYLVGDTNLALKFRETVTRQKRRALWFMPEIGPVNSANVASLQEHLAMADTPQITLVDGGAGYGKSTVVADVAESLQAAGWFVVVLRLDELGSVATTSRQLGEAAGWGSDSPAVLLAGVANGAPALLVIDQLDAVSQYSGRSPEAFAAIEDLLGELSGVTNVRVVLVVRTVDLESDQRFLRLARSAETARFGVDLLSETDVREKLGEAGLTEGTSAATVELLRTPLHFAIYMQLPVAAQRQVAPTIQSLYDRLTEKVRAGISRAGIVIDWNPIINALLADMNANERLSAPESIVMFAEPLHLQQLESAGILRRDRGRLSFFHETYFDYLFARTFVASGASLMEFLINSGQHLFRRAQTRQVLEHMAGVDRSQFRRSVLELLKSGEVRPHLKQVVTQVLGQIEPQPKDWLSIDHLAWSDDVWAWRILSLLRRPLWFDVVDEQGLWQSWLNDEARVDLAFHELRIIARERPTRVSELFTPFVGQSEAWRIRLRIFTEWSLTPESVPLVCQLLERGDLDDAKGPIAVNSDFWSIIYDLESQDPAAAATVIGAYLRRGLRRASEEGFADPFDSGHLPDHSPSDEVIAKTARGAPDAYLSEVLPFVIAVAIAGHGEPSEDLQASARWRFRNFGSELGVADEIFTGVEHALCELGAKDADRFETHVRLVSEVEDADLRFLACRALTRVGPADRAIEWLLSDVRNLTLGWSNWPCGASAELVRRWSSECSDEAFSRLEAALCGFRFRGELLPQGIRRYILMSSLDSGRRSGFVTEELRRLQRVFPTFTPDVGPTTRIEFESVTSPISDEAASRMTDEHWMRALRKYNGDHAGWDGMRRVPGAYELATTLGRLAASDPDRFVRLAMHFDSSINVAAMDNILVATYAVVAPDEWSALCIRAQDLYGSSIASTICRLAEQSKQLSEEHALIVCSFADDPDPETSFRPDPSEQSDLDAVSELDSRGHTCVRGRVAHVLAAELFRSGALLDLLLPTIKKLCGDPALEVRTAAAETVIAILNHDQQFAFVLAEELFTGATDVLGSRSGERLLRYLILRDQPRFEVHLRLALEYSAATEQAGGHVWAIARILDKLPQSVVSDVSALPEISRRAAAEVLALNGKGGADLLLRLFNDPDSDTRKSASKAMRNLDELPPPVADALVSGFIASAAFPEHYAELIHGLEDAPQVDRRTAVEACRLALDLAGSQVGDIRTSQALLPRAVLPIVLGAYRTGDDALRASCLDAIDVLAQNDAYGIDVALAEER